MDKTLDVEKPIVDQTHFGKGGGLIQPQLERGQLISLNKIQLSIIEELQETEFVFC